MATFEEQRLFEECSELRARLTTANKEIEKLQAELAKARAALEKINTIRSSIVGSQALNWSEHIYPLVEALNEAGFVGMPYPRARENFGTLIERCSKAEAENKTLRSRLEIDPGGSDKIDELTDALNHLRVENETLRRERDEARALTKSEIEIHDLQHRLILETDAKAHALREALEVECTQHCSCDFKEVDEPCGICARADAALALKPGDALRALVTRACEMQRDFIVMALEEKNDWHPGGASGSVMPQKCITVAKSTPLVVDDALGKAGT